LWGKQTVGRGGTANSILLEIERPQNQNPIFSDGQDVALLRVSVVDSNGLLARSAANEITFSVVSGAGRIVGTGNGNPSDHTPDQGNKRQVFNGLARVIVGANQNGSMGKLVIQASAAGIPSTQITINTIPRAGVKTI